MLKEFKAFIMRGNVLDLAVALVIGVAFGKIITSFVEDVLMPPIGLLLGRVDFSSLFINLSGKAYATLAEAKAAGAPTINYGAFLNTIVMFVIIAFAIFMIIRLVAKMQKAKVEDPTTKDCPYCATSIPINAVRCGYCTSDLEPIAPLGAGRG